MEWSGSRVQKAGIREREGGGSGVGGRGGRGLDGCGDEGRGQELWGGGRVVCSGVQLRVLKECHTPVSSCPRSGPRIASKR